MIIIASVKMMRVESLLNLIKFKAQFKF